MNLFQIRMIILIIPSIISLFINYRKEEEEEDSTNRILNSLQKEIYQIQMKTFEIFERIYQFLFSKTQNKELISQIVNCVIQITVDILVSNKTRLFSDQSMNSINQVLIQIAKNSTIEFKDYIQLLSQENRKLLENFMNNAQNKFTKKEAKKVQKRENRRPQIKLSMNFSNFYKK
eukprot:Anaeramoba_ignava/a101296_40.p1 GENE.a101296_40~~a101296_40.p1  ORF type:complete len:193 (-),score=64.28 a101296_40:54-578(-)